MATAQAGTRRLKLLKSGTLVIIGIRPADFLRNFWRSLRGGTEASLAGQGEARMHSLDPGVKRT